jgi:hypothetical protein
MSIRKSKVKSLLQEILWQITGVILLTILGVGSINASTNTNKSIQSLTIGYEAFLTKEYKGTYVVNHEDKYSVSIKSSLGNRYTASKGKIWGTPKITGIDTLKFVAKDSECFFDSTWVVTVYHSHNPISELQFQDKNGNEFKAKIAEDGFYKRSFFINNFNENYNFSFDFGFLFDAIDSSEISVVGDSLIVRLHYIENNPNIGFQILVLESDSIWCRSAINSLISPMGATVNGTLTYLIPIQYSPTLFRNINNIVSITVLNGKERVVYNKEFKKKIDGSKIKFKKSWMTSDTMKVSVVIRENNSPNRINFKIKK